MDAEIEPLVPGVEDLEFVFVFFFPLSRKSEMVFKFCEYAPSVPNSRMEQTRNKLISCMSLMRLNETASHCKALKGSVHNLYIHIVLPGKSSRVHGSTHTRFSGC